MHPSYPSAALLAALASAASGQTYSVLDLGEAVPGGGSYAFNIIDSGLATGTVPQDPACNPCHTHAFRLENWHVVDLGIPAGASPPDSEAYSLNAAGQIVGRSAMSGYYVPVLWLPAPAYGGPAGWNILPQFPGGVNSQAWGINDLGQIAGESRMSGQFGPVPVLWQFQQGAWQLQNLGTLGGSYGRGRAVNNLGQVVGQASAFNGALTPFIWLPAPAYGLPAGMTAMDPQFRSGDMFAMNAQGQAAGEVYPLAAVWLPAPDLGLPAGLSILDLSDITGGTIQFAFAYGINAGAVVGQLGLRTGTITYYYGWRWSGGHARLVHSMVDPALQLTIIDARGINASGQIAATGYYGSAAAQSHALILSPPCYANCDGSATPPALNVADFTCFLQRFAEGSFLPPSQQVSHYANCDGSTAQPVLNVADFTCFLQRFAAGCP